MARKHRKPTLKQVLAMKFINEGFSKRQAMIKAGYSPSTAENPKGKLFSRKGTQRLIDTLKSEMVNQGIVPEFVARKFTQWFDAKKIDHSHTGPDKEVEDYNIQMEAYDRWQKIMGIEETDPKIRRKLTIEEFIDGTDKGGKDGS